MGGDSEGSTATPVVSNSLHSPSGAVVIGALVRVELVSSEGTPLEGGFVQGSPDYQIVGPYATESSAAGLWSLTLIANALIAPANSYYRAIQTTPTGVRYEDTFQVPNGAGPYDLADCLHEPSTIAAPGAVTVAQLTAHLVHAAPAAAPADATLTAGSIAFWLNESTGHLMMKGKKANSTIITQDLGAYS